MFPGLSELCKSGLMLLVSYGMYGLLGAFEKPNYSANPHNHICIGMSKICMAMLGTHMTKCNLK